MTEQPPDAMLEQWLTAYVSQDTKIIGIEHPTEADWQEVLNAHIALRDRLNVRIAEQDKCPHKPATPATDAASEKLVQRLRNWQREMERSSDTLRAMPGGNIDGTEMNEAANGSGAVAEALEDAADHITAQQAEIDRLTGERDHWLGETQRVLKAGQEAAYKLTAAEARLAEMREALEPFAKWADSLEAEIVDETIALLGPPDGLGGHLTCGEFRRARAAIAKIGDPNDR
jgi:chromosome segregation ATPase